MKEFEGKKLLILGGIRLSCDIVKRAQEMGAYVVVADYNRIQDSPAKQIADEAVLIDALDVDAIVDYCISAHIDGVTTGFVDILLQPCYEVCQRLGLPCYLTPKMIEVSTNKVSFKKACEHSGVLVPQTYLVGDRITDDIYERIVFPVFVKPLDASGCRGASVCYNRAELDRQFTEALGYSKSHNVVVEDYLDGREFLMNFIAQDGEFRMISMFDRYVTNDRGSAINYASLSIGPSKSVDYYLDEVNDNVVKMFKSLGFKDGIYFLQGFFNEKDIKFYEMGCRLGGSYYDLEDKCIGVDPVKMLIRYALTARMTDNFNSIPVRAGKYRNVAVCVNYLLKNGQGTIKKIEGIDKIKQMDSIVYCDQQFAEGDFFNDGDKIFDKPVLCVYLEVENMQQLVRDVNYMNSIFDVYDENGFSLLKEKFNPELL